MPKQTNVFWAVVILVVVIILWASAYVAIRLGLHGFTPGPLGLLRYGIASIVMALIYAKQPHRHWPTGREFVQLALAGSIGIGLYNILINRGEIEASAALASFVLGFVPIMVMIIAVLLKRETVSLRGWCGVLLSTVGLWIIFIEQPHGQNLQTTGLLPLCVAVLCASFYITMQKSLLKRLQPLEVVSWCIWFATLAMSFETPKLLHELHYASLGSLGAAVYLGIFPAALAFAGWSVVLKYIPVTQASLGLLVLPVITLLMGWAVLGETLSTGVMAGGLLLLTGALIASKLWQRRAPSK